LNWPTGFGKKISKKVSVYLYSFAVTFPWRWGLNLEAPLPKDLCQLWLELAKWFWERSRNCKSLADRKWTTSNKKSSLDLNKTNPKWYLKISWHGSLIW
jgi:hypothetical protein